MLGVFDSGLGWLPSSGQTGRNVVGIVAPTVEAARPCAAR